MPRTRAAGDRYLIGADEAGRGPALGPLVVAAVAIPAEKEEALRSLGVRDSKVLTPAARALLEPQILGMANVSIEEVPADRVDSALDRGTMNTLEEEVFGEAIEGVAAQCPAGAMFQLQLDAADVEAPRFGRSVMAHLDPALQHRIPEVLSEHRADARYPTVSAASIVAKVLRDRRMEEIARELRVRLDAEVGSGYPSDPKTVSFMEKWIKRFGHPPPHARRSWRTTVDLVARSRTRTLESFESDLEE